MNYNTPIHQLRQAVLENRLDPFATFHGNEYTMFHLVLESTDIETMFILLDFATHKRLQLPNNTVPFLEFLKQSCSYPEQQLEAWITLVRYYRMSRQRLVTLIEAVDNQAYLYVIYLLNKTTDEEKHLKLEGALHYAIEKDDELMVSILLTYGKRSLEELYNNESAVIFAIRTFQKKCLLFMSEYTNALDTVQVKTWLEANEVYKIPMRRYLNVDPYELNESYWKKPLYVKRILSAHYYAYQVMKMEQAGNFDLVRTVEKMLGNPLIRVPHTMKTFATDLYKCLRITDASIYLIALIHSQVFPLEVYKSLYEAAKVAKDAHLIFYLMNISSSFYEQLVGASNARDSSKYTRDEAAISAIPLYSWDPNKIDNRAMITTNREWNYLFLMVKSSRALMSSRGESYFKKYVEGQRQYDIADPLESLIMMYLFHDKFKTLIPNRTINPLYDHWLNFNLNDFQMNYFDHFKDRMLIEGPRIIIQMLRYGVYDENIVQLMMRYDVDPYPLACIYSIDTNRVNHVQFILSRKEPIHLFNKSFVYKGTQFDTMLSWICRHREQFSQEMTVLLQTYLNMCAVTTTPSMITPTRLTPKQMELIEKSRQEALEKRTRSSNSTSSKQPNYTPEQLARMEKNRQEALARRRERQIRFQDQMKEEQEQEGQLVQTANTSPSERESPSQRSSPSSSSFINPNTLTRREEERIHQVNQQAIYKQGRHANFIANPNRKHGARDLTKAPQPDLESDQDTIYDSSDSEDMWRNTNSRSRPLHITQQDITKSIASSSSSSSSSKSRRSRRRAADLPGYGPITSRQVIRPKNRYFTPEERKEIEKLKLERAQQQQAREVVSLLSSSDDDDNDDAPSKKKKRRKTKAYCRDCGDKMKFEDQEKRYKKCKPCRRRKSWDLTLMNRELDRILCACA